MRIRRATEADLPALRGVWEAFQAELPEPPHRVVDPDTELEEIAGYVRDALALVADADGTLVGYALAKIEAPKICYLSDLYVNPDARRAGAAKALLGETAAWGREQGAEVMTLEVLATNHPGRVVYERLGFVEESLNLVAPLDVLSERVTRRERAPSFGSIHVQTDDADAVVRSVELYVPRLPGGSRGSVVSQPANGWVAVYDELCDREPEMLRRLAQDISNRMAPVIILIAVEEQAVVRYILFERGRIVDEYLSVPEYYGPLPPGDVVGLGANPTVAHRLTGADPDRLRETARIARSPAELPPATELLSALAGELGLEGAAVGYAEARGLPGATILDRG
jgi:ribosomal protein S18 acetylase RimI-like enzyme